MSGKYQRTYRRGTERSKDKVIGNGLLQGEVNGDDSRGLVNQNGAVLGESWIEY